MTGRTYGAASRELDAQIAEVAASLEAVQVEATDTKIAVVLSYLHGQRITRGTVRNRRARMTPQGA